MGPIAKMSVTPAVTETGGDGRGAQGPSMITAHESEHEVPAGGVSNELEGIFDGLRAADIEMHAPFDPKTLLAMLGDTRGHLHLLRVQVLAGKLRQAIELAFQRLDQPAVLVAEARRGIPHLKIQVRYAMFIVEITAFAIDKNLGGIQVVDRISKGAVFPLQGQQLRGLRNGLGNRHSVCTSVKTLGGQVFAVWPNAGSQSRGYDCAATSCRIVVSAQGEL